MALTPASPLMLERECVILEEGPDINCWQLAAGRASGPAASVVCTADGEPSPSRNLSLILGGSEPSSLALSLWICHQCLLRPGQHSVRKAAPTLAQMAQIGSVSCCVTQRCLALV